MRLACLGSGSSGNATLIDIGDGYLLVDCGLSARETKSRMLSLHLDFKQIRAILVTHEHADHIAGVAAVSSQTGAPVYATRGTSIKLKSECHIIRADEEFYLSGSDIKIRPVAVPHDAREPVQFTFSCGDTKLGVLTDLGSVTPHVIEAFSGCQTLLVEANHCKDLLANGPYPAALKRRILGPWGHLSNHQTQEFLQGILARGPAPKHLIIGHISKENNSKSRVEEGLGALAEKFQSVVFASQDEAIPWVV